MATGAAAQSDAKKLIELPDSTPLLNGIEVYADLVGVVMKAVGDYGHLEAGLHLNLKDKYFPAVELGYATCDHIDEGTTINYKTKAPYLKVGIDFNVMRDKHDIYRIFVGARYAFTSFKVDYFAPIVKDPLWGSEGSWGEEGMKCTYHWAEAVAGVQAKIWGPISLGWTARYRRRLKYTNGDYSNAWYVPGYGQSKNSAIFATFNVIIGI